jgi:diguanylate cyclase (GGDEF)-like protein
MQARGLARSITSGAVVAFLQRNGIEQGVARWFDRCQGRVEVVEGSADVTGERLVIDDADRVAEGRDLAAERRDRAARQRDRTAADHAGTDDLCVRERDDAAREREAASRDRAEAARDRDAAAHDRLRAARDRSAAGVDPLTGALRRDRGLADLQREIDRARRSDGRLVLAFVDVDGLKPINDTHGHAAGDQLLRDVAVALKRALRSYDLVIRYGGDEFLCALPGTDLEGARRRFGEVARSLTKRPQRASVSVGLAALEDPDTVDALTARADAELYAGRRGRRRQADARPRARFSRSA